ncbi:MAG: nicotinate (nicotinamide) nucleotide adenylyltransferase [Magnetococcales bacterium]|nr:nicotinate (nicotinamide) nucleotide adenylyltransferase [Magnetococcales bacterium]
MAAARLGILGGSFNPPHYGHLRLALECVERLSLPQLLFMPAGHHPLKSTMAASHRLAMVELAIASESRFSVCRHEIDSNGVCYTVDTLAALKQLHSDRELVFVVGSDLLGELHLWRQWRQLLRWAHLCCLQRPSHDDDYTPHPPTPSPTGGEEEHEAAKVRAWLRDHQVATPEDLCYDSTNRSHKVVSLPMTALEISSSAIRRCLQAGQSPRYLLPDAVLNYIQQNGLYH